MNIALDRVGYDFHRAVPTETDDAVQNDTRGGTTPWFSQFLVPAIDCIRGDYQVFYKNA